MSIQFLQFLLGIIFASVIFLHLTKKNLAAALAYGLQSLAVAAIFFNYFLETGNSILLLIVILSLIVKVILAPLFFIKLIKKYRRIFSDGAYLDVPGALIIIALLTFVAHSHKFSALTNLLPANQSLLTLALAIIFLALFLIINQKEALAQIIGILSLENGIVAFALLSGLEQSPALQIGIIFNIFIWLMVTTVFMSMIYKHFGTFNVTALNNLKD